VTTAIDHPSRRLVVALPQIYDEARERYESLFPEVDFARFAEMTSWRATLELAEFNAPHRFMRYYRSDITVAGRELDGLLAGLITSLGGDLTAFVDADRETV
jgi:hypothetical protein